MTLECINCAGYQHPFNFCKTEFSVAVADGLPTSFQSLRLLIRTVILLSELLFGGSAHFLDLFVERSFVGQVSPSPKASGSPPSPCKATKLKAP
jgi:hypothetical protein